MVSHPRATPAPQTSASKEHGANTKGSTRKAWKKQGQRAVATSEPRSEDEHKANEREAKELAAFRRAATLRKAAPCYASDCAPRAA